MSRYRKRFHILESGIISAIARACIALSLFAGALSDVAKEEHKFDLIGNYVFIDCTSPQISTFTAILSAQRQALFYASADLASRPDRSVHGYSLFFNTQENIPKVQKIVNQLIAQQPKTFPLEGFGGSNPSQPTFICLQPYATDPFARQLLAVCGPTQYAAYRNKSPVIIICPAFWGKTRTIPTSSDCGKIDARDNFAGSQFNIILHELIHFYEYPASYLDPEVYDMDQCIALPPTESALNAQNYAYYIMGFTAGCIYPLRLADPFIGRELLWSGVQIATDTIGKLVFNLTASGPRPPQQLGWALPADASSYTSAILSVPPDPRAVINATYASVFIPRVGFDRVVGISLTDLSAMPGSESCYNKLLHGDYVEDLNAFVHFVLNPIYQGNWTAAGVVKNATDKAFPPVDCMLIRAAVYTGPGSL